MYKDVRRNDDVLGHGTYISKYANRIHYTLKGKYYGSRSMRDRNCAPILALSYQYNFFASYEK